MLPPINYLLNFKFPYTSRFFTFHGHPPPPPCNQSTNQKSVSGRTLSVDGFTSQNVLSIRHSDKPLKIQLQETGGRVTYAQLYTTKSLLWAASLSWQSVGISMGGGNYSRGYVPVYVWGGCPYPHAGLQVSTCCGYNIGYPS